MKALQPLLQKGFQGIILGFETKNQAYRRRFLAMGLTPGVPFEVIRIAPLGDPIEVRVRNFCLSLRREEFALLRFESASGDVCCSQK